jgi:hypothetical protein
MDGRGHYIRFTFLTIKRKPKTTCRVGSIQYRSKLVGEMTCELPTVTLMFCEV